MEVASIVEELRAAGFTPVFPREVVGGPAWEKEILLGTNTCSINIKESFRGDPNKIRVSIGDVNTEAEPQHWKRAIRRVIGRATRCGINPSEAKTLYASFGVKPFTPEEELDDLGFTYDVDGDWRNGNLMVSLEGKVACVVDDNGCSYKGGSSTVKFKHPHEWWDALSTAVHNRQKDLDYQKERAMATFKWIKEM